MTQSEALDILKLGHNVFLTGAAGSGKTFLLNQYIFYLREHGVGVAITASTGIAATHLGGQTIHSWSGMGVRDSLETSEVEKIVKNDRIKRNFKKTKVLVIDEVSMLHAHQLDSIDLIARGALDAELPFGGLQVILCGDFFQLPPVMRGSHQEKVFAYESEAWENGEFKTCYLHEQFRQGEDELLSVLQAIRSGDVDEYTKMPLRTRYKKDTPGEVQPTRLYAKNINVDAINIKELEKLSSQESFFVMKTTGYGTLVEALKRGCLASEVLHLKVGAEVMFIKNSAVGDYVNGTRGVVEAFEDNERWPVVRTIDGNKIIVYPEEWRFEEEGVVRASLTQVPLRLAWAITIHKSQGMTLDAAEVDLSDTFEPGMGYVALSRVRSLSGLKLMGINEVALSVHPKILEHDRKFQEQSDDAAALSGRLSNEEKETLFEEVLIKRFAGARFKKDVTKGKIYKKPTHEITREFLEKKLSLEDIAKERGMTVGTILGHMEKLKGFKLLPDSEHLKPSQKDFDKIVHEFKKIEGTEDEGKLTPVFNALQEKYSFDMLKLVRLFMS